MYSAVVIIQLRPGPQPGTRLDCPRKPASQYLGIWCQYGQQLHLGNKDSPAYITNFVTTSTSYLTRGFSSARNILSSEPPSLRGGVTGFVPAVTPGNSTGSFDRRWEGGSSCLSWSSIGDGRGLTDDVPSTGLSEFWLSRLSRSLCVIISRTSASDCGPMETARLRGCRKDVKKAGMSLMGGITLSSFRSGGTCVYWLRHCQCL